MHKKGARGRSELLLCRKLKVGRSLLAISAVISMLKTHTNKKIREKAG